MTWYLVKYRGNFTFATFLSRKKEFVIKIKSKKWNKNILTTVRRKCKIKTIHMK